jgi:F-type H+-transporting ATPase subunit b
MRKIFTLCTLFFLLGLMFVSQPALVYAAEVTEGHAVEGSVGADHETEGYSSSQWRDFGWRVANFVVFALVLFFLLKKPVVGFFHGRQEDIGRTLEYLETQSRNLAEQTQVMRRKLNELSQERIGILTQYEREGARERDRIIAEAQKTAEVIIQRAEAAVSVEIMSAKRALVKEVGELAKNIAENQLREQVTAEDRSSLALDFVEQVIKLPSRK